MANDKDKKSNVRLIIGSHGTGKSDWLYNRFVSMSRNEKDSSKVDLSKKLFLFVPEQDTNEKQRTMMKKMKEYGFGAGIFNIDVVSFDRIAHNVFDILAIEPAKENVIDDDAKAMILSLVVSELNKNNELKYYKRMINKMGFAKKLTEAVSELYSYDVNDEEMAKVSEVKNISYVLKGKLEDLSKIYLGFKNKLKELNYFIKEDKYDLLNKNVLNTDIFNDAIVAFDGFTGFTPVQLDIFKKIASVAREVYVLIEHRNASEILNYNFDDLRANDDSNVDDIFYLSKKFIKDIMGAFKIRDIKELLCDYSIKDEVLKYRSDNKDSFIKNEKNDLKFIEDNLYKNIDFAGLFDKQIENIDCYVANSIEEEVRNSTQIITDLVRNKGLKYSDIKIVVSNVDSYRDTIIRSFNRSNIPLFIDDSESILNSPYVEVIRAALDVANFNFSYDSVIRYLNSGIFEKSREICAFDNFIRKHAIRGFNRYKTGFEKISVSDEDKNYIIGIKNKFLNPLLELYEDIKGRKKVSISDYIDAIGAILNRINIDEKFDNLIQDIEKCVDSDISLYRELGILKYSKEVITNTFKQLLDIEKNNSEAISLEDFKLIFEVGVTSKGVKSIPYLIDQVVVGDLMRSRFDNPKVEIVLGLNQSLIPAKTSDMTIIDDEMRMVFANTVKELSQTTIETALNQRFYIYLALTNPIDKLILSYTRADVNGDADEKSPVLTMIEDMFADKEKVDKKGAYISKLQAKEVDDSKFKIYNRNDLISFVALNMQNVKNSSIKDENGKLKYNFDIKDLKSIYRAKELINYLETNDKEYFDGIYSGVLYQNNYVKVNNVKKEINEDLIHLKNGKLCSSASSIELFNSCPYKFFLSKTLKISEREEYSISPIDLGNLAHSVFEKVFNDVDIVDKDENQVENMVDNEVEAGFKMYDSFKEFDKKNNDYFGVNRLEYVKGRTKDLMKKSVHTLIDIAKSSKLKVLKTECSFAYDVLDETRVDGRMDRVETFNDGDSVYVNVIDYKSGREKKFNRTNLENGTDIQLILYIDYCMNEIFKRSDKKPVFCGSFYFNLSDSINTKDIATTLDTFNEEERANVGYSGIANSSKKVLVQVFPDAIFDTKVDGDSIKSAKLKNNNFIGKNFISEEELNQHISGLHDTIDETTKKIKSGYIVPTPVDFAKCNNCPYITICKKDQMLNIGDEESEG